MHDLALEPWSSCGRLQYLVTAGPGVKYLDRKSSRPVTWVIKIKHAGLGVLGQNRKENYGFYILDSCTNFSACSILIYGAMGVKWTTLTFKELAAQRTLRMDAKYWIKKKASSRKHQAPSNKRHNPDTVR